MDDSKTITIFFHATFGKAKQNKTIFDLLTSSIEQSESNKKKDVDGVGVTHNALTGSLFGIGIDDDVDNIYKEISNRLEQGEKICLNLVGEGQGGISACRLIQRLSEYSQDVLETHLALYNPKPGNTEMAVHYDYFNWTWANSVMDLSNSRNLTQVLSFYSNGKIFNFFSYIPIVPVYPKQCRIDEEVLPGYDDEHMTFFKKKYYYLSQTGFIVMERLREFLVKQGVQFNNQLKDSIFVSNQLQKYDPSNNHHHSLLKTIYRDIFNQQKKAFYNKISFSRSTHSSNGCNIKTQFSRSDFLTTYHKFISNGKENEKEALFLENRPLADSRMTSYSGCFFNFYNKTPMQTIGFIMGATLSAAFVLSPLMLTGSPWILPVLLFMKFHFIKMTLLTLAVASIGGRVGEYFADKFEKANWPSLEPYVCIPTM